MPRRETEAKMSVLQFYWEVLSRAILTKEWRIGQQSWVSKKLTAMQLRLSLQPKSHMNAQHQGFVSPTPPLTGHFSIVGGTSFLWPWEFQREIFRWELSANTPSSEESEHHDPRQHTQPPPPLCVCAETSTVYCEVEKARSGTLTCRCTVSWDSCLFSMGMTLKTLSYVNQGMADRSSVGSPKFHCRGDLHLALWSR